MIGGKSKVEQKVHQNFTITTSSMSGEKRPRNEDDEENNKRSRIANAEGISDTFN